MQISDSVLPDDLVQEILSFLPGEDLARASSVCTAFNENASNDVWSKVFSRKYPLLEQSLDGPKEQYKLIKQREILQKEILYRPTVYMGPPPPKFPSFENLDNFVKKINKRDKLKNLYDKNFLDNKSIKTKIDALLKESQQPIISLKLDVKDLLVKKIDLTPEDNIQQILCEDTFVDRVAKSVDSFFRGVMNFF